MSRCKQCDLQETPILLELLQDWFKMDRKKVINVYHKKGHKIF